MCGRGDVRAMKAAGKETSAVTESTEHKVVGTSAWARAAACCFKSATAIEASKRVDVVMMNKTGMLTLGASEVRDLVVDGMPAIDALEFFAAVERESEHSLAQAVVRHLHAADAPRWDVEGLSSVPGEGAVAAVDGHRVAVGTSSLMEDGSVEVGALGATQRDLAAGGRTSVWSWSTAGPLR